MKQWICLVPILIGVLGCAGAPTPHEVTPRKLAQSLDVPPMTTSLDSWAYTWTDNSEAATDPAGYIGRQLAYGKNCVSKLNSASEDQMVPQCEGEGMAAGPGLYTCDNPFTSHDYGSTVVAIRILGGNRTFGLATGRFRPAPASPGLERFIYGNPSFSGLIYDFRVTDFNSRALVLRGPESVDVAKSFSISVKPSTYAVFGRHEPYECSPSTSIKDLLSHWGDHMEFMAITFDFFRDNSGNEYLKGISLNDAGFAAAIASDAVAASDDVLNQRVNALRAHDDDFAGSISRDACIDSGTHSLRSCLARRVFDSLLDNKGTPRNPNYIWSIPTLRKALLSLKVAGHDDVKASSLTELRANMVRSYRGAAPNALRAYRCMKTVRAAVEKMHYGLWGEDP